MAEVKCGFTSLHFTLPWSRDLNMNNLESQSTLRYRAVPVYEAISLHGTAETSITAKLTVQIQRLVGAIACCAGD